MHVASKSPKSPNLQRCSISKCFEILYYPALLPPITHPQKHCGAAALAIPLVCIFTVCNIGIRIYEKKLGYTDGEYVAAVDSGKYTNFVRDSAGFGLAQWTYWSRKQNLLNFAKSKNKSIGDLEMQLDFLWKEMSESYKSVLNTLKTATSVLAASNDMRNHSFIEDIRGYAPIE